MKRLWLAAGWFCIVAIIWLSLTPRPIETDLPDGDKLQHILAYGTLMAWWAQLQVDKAQRVKLALYFVALGIALEFAQAFTPNRTPDVFDALADATGVLLGWLASPPRLPNVYTRLAAAVSRTQA